MMKKILLFMTVMLPFVLISCGDDKDGPVVPDNHEYVDLGLPSGTLWATCNIGANSPEEYGDYFAWGETSPKEEYGWSNYKWCKWDPSLTLTKYNYNSESGKVDSKIELDPKDDAAYVNWGPSWRMPSKEQQYELYKNCTSKWTSQKGVYGYLFTGPNGNTLFLPAAGRWYFSYGYDGMGALYWSRTLFPQSSTSSYMMTFSYWSTVELQYIERAGGVSVRAVRASKK